MTLSLAKSFLYSALVGGAAAAATYILGAEIMNAVSMRDPAPPDHCLRRRSPGTLRRTVFWGAVLSVGVAPLVGGMAKTPAVIDASETVIAGMTTGLLVGLDYLTELPH